MRTHRIVLPLLILTLALSAPAVAQQARRFSPEVALDVRNARIVDMTDDGSLIAVTVQTRRGRTDVDHQRYGDPTYLSPAGTRLMVIDTRSGAQTWVHEEPAQIRGFTFSPDGTRLGYFMAHDDRYELHIYDVAAASWTMPELQTNKEIASSSPLVWSPDGTKILVGLRPDGWREEASQAFWSVTEAPVIVQDSRNDFLAWDRVRNLSNRQDTALVDLSDFSVREVLTETPPQGLDFSADGSYLTYATSTPTKTSYTRRDGTEYALFRLDVAGGDPVALIDPRDERINVDWTEARDAFAYSDEGSVFVRRIGEDEAVDVTTAHRHPKEESAEEAGAEPGADEPAEPSEPDRRDLEPRFSVA
ncbi:MAG: hypothetical protein PVJ51_13375, partial [Acidobacteriota bacterium]